MCLEPGSVVRLACERVGLFCLLVGWVGFQNTNLFNPAILNNFICQDRHCCLSCLRGHFCSFLACQIWFHGQKMGGVGICLLPFVVVLVCLRKPGRELRPRAQEHLRALAPTRKANRGVLQWDTSGHKHITRVHTRLNTPQPQTMGVSSGPQIMLMRVYFLNTHYFLTPPKDVFACEDKVLSR